MKEAFLAILTVVLVAVALAPVAGMAWNAIVWTKYPNALKALGYQEPALLGFQSGAITNFIPTVWSARGLRVLEKSFVYGSPRVVNRNWEGDIQNAGDTVKITSLGDVTISNYTRNADIPAPEVLSDSARTLVVDQAKVFNFAVDDVDDAQANQDLIDPAMSKAATKLRDAADQFIASKYVDVTTIVGSDAAPILPTSDTAYTLLIDLGVAMDEDDIPTEGRYVVVPPWYIGLLTRNQLFQTNFGPDAFRNGFQGRAAGFDVLVSNNVPTIVNGSAETVYQVLAGIPDGITFAEQISKVEAYRPERRFSDAVKGLYVYGGKAIQPELLSLLKVKRA